MPFKERLFHNLYNDDRIRILKGPYEGQTGKILRWLFTTWYLVKMDISGVEIVVGVHLGELEPLDLRR